MAQANSLAGLDLMAADTVVQDYGKWLIYGAQGSGKSTLAASVAELGPTLYIDLIGERGVRSFQGAPYAENIKVVRPQSVTQFDDLYWALDKGDHGFSCVVIDSLTSVQRMALKFVMGLSEDKVREIAQGQAPADQRTWGQSLNIMSDVAIFWNSLADGNRKRPMHVVMTAQVKMIEDEINQETNRQPDVQKGALSSVLAAPDYVLYTEVEDDLDNYVDGAPGVRHVVRIGPHSGFRTKGRIPQNLRGKIPPVLGRGKNTTNLAQLSRILGIGGVTAPTA